VEEFQEEEEEGRTSPPPPEPRSPSQNIDNTVSGRAYYLLNTAFSLHMSSEQLVEFARSFQLEVFQPDSIIFNQGDPADSILVIAEGTIRLRCFSQVLLTQLSPLRFLHCVLFGNFHRSSGIVRSPQARAETIIIFSCPSSCTRPTCGET
jgi:hypothetical protein